MEWRACLLTECPVRSEHQTKSCKNQVDSGQPRRLGWWTPRKFSFRCQSCCPFLSSPRRELLPELPRWLNDDSRLLSRITRSVRSFHGTPARATSSFFVFSNSVLKVVLHKNEHEHEHEGEGEGEGIAAAATAIFLILKLDESSRLYRSVPWPIHFCNFRKGCEVRALRTHDCYNVSDSSVPFKPNQERERERVVSKW